MAMAHKIRKQVTSGCLVAIVSASLLPSFARAESLAIDPYLGAWSTDCASVLKDHSKFEISYDEGQETISYHGIHCLLGLENGDFALSTAGNCDINKFPQELFGVYRILNDNRIQLTSVDTSRVYERCVEG
jgi:hypothetical protein